MLGILSVMHLLLEVLRSFDRAAMVIIVHLCCTMFELHLVCTRLPGGFIAASSVQLLCKPRWPDYHVWYHRFVMPFYFVVTGFPFC
jgi:hypothetical protein